MQSKFKNMSDKQILAIRVPRNGWSIEDKSELFLLKMKIIHPTYVFSEFVYQGALTKGTYFCDNPEHGAREARPGDLLRGVGCSACAGKCPVQAEKNFFIKMKKIHPTYDFSEFVYKTTSTKGTYYCDNPEHGAREASPSSLLSEQGCSACAGCCPVQAEKEFFIKMKIIHPTYDFSEFVYKGSKTKGTYFCDNPEHGAREASPDHLLNGKGCSACAGCCPVQAEKNFFIKMKKIHPTYDFSEFVYKSKDKKGTYYCDNPEHGAREARPGDLLRGVGCSACADCCPVQAKKDFFIKMKIIHPTYDFSEFVYKNAHTKGTYYCDNPEHGAREASPSSLLSEQGCSACAGCCPVQAEKEFFIKMKIIHPTYVFSEFVYQGALTKGTYFCDNPEHGAREARPGDLLRGVGCSICNQNRRVQQKKIFEALKTEFPFLDWQWEKRYPCMLNTEFDISALLPSGELVAVEYDGEQHYMPVNFGGRSVGISEIAFDKQQKDDKIKDKLAADNNINLFRISYFEWNDNNNDMLHELFGNIEDLI